MPSPPDHDDNDDGDVDCGDIVADDHDVVVVDDDYDDDDDDDEGDEGQYVEVSTTATVDPALATMAPMHRERMN